MRLVRRLRDLTTVDKQMLGRAVLLLWGLRVLLGVAHYRRVFRLVMQLAARRRDRRCGEPGRVPERVRWAVEVVARYTPWRLSCLCQAMAGLVLANELGLVACLRIGMKRGDLFKGHAWLETDTGVILGEVEDLDQFVLLPLNQETRSFHPVPLSGPDGAAEYHE